MLTRSHAMAEGLAYRTLLCPLIKQSRSFPG
jgi:hypothetical protein